MLLLNNTFLFHSCVSRARTLRVSARSPLGFLYGVCKLATLTNRMWFSVGYNRIDNNARHHSGQNVVDSRGAAEWVRDKFWPLWWRVSLSIRVYTTLNHIRFVFYHNIKEIFVLTIENTDSDLKVHALHYANELLVRVRLFFQKLLETRAETIQKNAWEKSNDTYSLSTRVQTTKNHISICFLDHNINVKENVFFSERELEKALRDTLTRAAW